MKRLSFLLAGFVLSSLPLAAAKLPQTAEPAPVTPAVEQPASPAPELPLFGTPEPLNASSCRAVSMTYCDGGYWLTCEGSVLCDAGWKWVYCDGHSQVCPECAWGGPCL
jgi:hypothetical protein